jgi:thiosulfate/3-mercaptopyruvate sulfurtransferase
MDNPDSGLIVHSWWLEEHLGDTDVLPVDVRVPFLFGQAHLPGAVNIPQFFLTGPDAGPPDPRGFAQRLGAVGVTRDSYVIAYDDGASPAAARLLWVLRYLEHPRVAMLDGGITAWMREDRPIETGPPQRAPGQYQINGNDDSVIADAEYTRASIGRSDAIIVDVRAPDEYLGLRLTAARNGHIPTAINIDWTNNFQVGDDAIVRLKAPDDLRLMYESAGVTPDKEVIVHCQAANRASETFAVLKALDYPRVRTYSPGWLEWGNRFDVPVDGE